MTARKKVSEVQIAKMIAFDPDLVPVVDDVYGTVEVWLASDYTCVRGRVVGRSHSLSFSKVPVSKDERGTFWNQSSYIVLYNGTRDTVLYFWQGSQSATLWTHARDSITEVLSKAQERAGTKVPIIRLLEGDEPPHFLGIFDGCMLVRHGQAGSFDSMASFLTMYQVRGFNVFNTRYVCCCCCCFRFVQVVQLH